MKVVILDKRVRRNIALFRHLLFRQTEKEKQFFQTAKKAYKGYINRKTGEIAFALLKQKTYRKKDWKPVVIRLHPDEEGAFEIFSEGEEGYFDCSDLEKESYALLTKTMHILNQISYDPKKGKNPFWVLKHVAVLDLVLAEEDGKKSLVHEAWHNMDRSYAEYFLSHQSIGTYLFRKDEFAQILEDSLNEKHADPVVCITLTYRSSESKISEKTLVYRKNRWAFYDNDPTLPARGYGTVRELLATLGDQLKAPALADPI